MATGIFEGAEENPMFQSLARQRTRSVFGVPMPKFLAGVAQGIGSYDPQGGFFGNFARGLSGSLQGGMGYDQRQQEQERQSEQDAWRQLFIQSQIDENEAQAQRAAMPREDPRVSFMRSLGIEDANIADRLFPVRAPKPSLEDRVAEVTAIETARGKVRSQFRAPDKPKAEKPPAPIKRRLPKEVTEQDILDAIQSTDDPKALTTYMMGRGSADSADIRRAAQLKLNSIQRQAR